MYREIKRELSVGDRIQFTAPDKSLGVANRDMAAIETIHPDGRLSVRLDNNRQIEFNPNEHRHLDHGLWWQAPSWSRIPMPDIRRKFSTENTLGANFMLPAADDSFA